MMKENDEVDDEGDIAIKIVPTMSINYSDTSKFRRCLAKFKLGKIFNKYLIFEIFSFTYSNSYLIYQIGNASRSLRSLLIQNKDFINHSVI